MMNRHELRDRVFRLLFRVEFNSPEEMPEQVRFFCEDEDYGTIEEEDSAFVKDKFDKIISHKDELDAVISENISGWDLDRIGKVELAVLRLAAYEMIMDEEIPTGVAMDEAIEIAKTYGQENSGSFVNAVLSKIKTAKGIE